MANHQANPSKGDGYYRDDLAYIQAAGFGSFAEAAVPFLVETIRSLARRNPKVIDLGCGAGVTTAALHDAGFDVTGVEPSPALLNYARRTAPDARFHQASAYDVPMSRCDAILAVGEVLTYHPDLSAADDRVRTFIETTHTALAPGGLLIFDFIDVEGPDLSGRHWISADDWAVLTETIDEPKFGRITRRIETFRAVGEYYRRDTETHTVRLFASREMRKWLETAGFEVRFHHAYGAFDLPPRRAAVVATRL